MKTAFKTYYQRFRAWVEVKWVDAMIALFAIVAVLLILTVVGVAITAVDVVITKRNFDAREAYQVRASNERRTLIEITREQQKYLKKAARLNNLTQ